MDWLIHNPIAEIHGPAFLLVYGVIAFAVIMVAYRGVRARDKTGLREPPPVPATFDPYELAYLRDGTNEVIRTVMYALHRRGLVTVTPKERFKSSRLVAVDDWRNAATLTELEQLVLRQLSRPADPSSLFSSMLKSSVDRLCLPYQARLESEQLLRTEAMKEGAMLVPLAATAVLLGLTVYKVALAVAEARPVAFLIILTIVAIIILWVRVGAAVWARVSDRGNAYIKRLQMAYQNVPRPTPRGAAQGSQDEGSDLQAVAMVGLFGFGILSATPDAAFAGLFAKAAAGGGGCGSGCGGGGGGGGGGCGGGGCGG